jgi:hypothetical protein
MTVPLSPPSADLEEPPPPTGRVLTVGLVGVGLVLTAFVLGLATNAPRQGFDTHPWDGPRALLSILGLFLAGCAVSMRPGWYGGWLCGAAAGLLGYGLGAPPPYGTEWHVAPPRDWFAAVPNSWDSIQLFFGVAGVIGLVGAVVTRLPARARYGLALCWAAYHFAGITSAITSPPPSPWLADQYWNRVAKRYLQFCYLNNAYQFYSPDPGPACELWVCLEYKAPAAEDKAPRVEDDPEAPKDCAWAFIPRRKEHYQDPLGLTYYRRLSLAERVAQYVSQSYVPLAPEQQQMYARRQRVTNEIPRRGWRDEMEYRLPNDLVTRHTLPSFARHLAAAYGQPGKEVKSVKIYRTLHYIIDLDQFHGQDLGTGRPPIPPMSPYDPSLYLPYFQGEFKPDGTLVDPTDPLLYWLVPILPEPGRTAPFDRAEYRKTGGFSRYFTEYVSKHAGCPLPTEEFYP